MEFPWKPQRGRIYFVSGFQWIMVKQSFMVEGQSRAKLLTSYWLGSRERQRESRTRYSRLYRKQVVLLSLIFFFLNLFFLIFMYFIWMSVFDCIYVYTWGLWREKSCSGPWNWSWRCLWVTMCMLRTESRSSVRGAGALDLWAISQMLLLVLLLFECEKTKNSISFILCVCIHKWVHVCRHHHGHVEVRGWLARVNILLHVSHRD